MRPRRQWRRRVPAFTTIGRAARGIAACLVACATVAVAHVAGPPPAVAGPQSSDAAAVIVAALGFDGRGRLGAWTPVWIDVVANTDIDGVVMIDAPTPTGEPLVRYGAPVRAAAGARVRVFVPAIFFDSRRPGIVHLEVGGASVASIPLPRLRAVDELVVVLSSEPLGVEGAALKAGRLDIAYVPAETLPPRWQAFEAVRLLVVRDLDERRLDDAQREAMRGWLLTGGRLLVVPAGDDSRHAFGPTVGPVRQAARAGRYGLGTLRVWSRDPADPAVRGTPGAARAWEDVLAAGPDQSPPSLEPTVPAGRSVPLRAHVAVGIAVLLYVLVIRRAGPVVASLRLVPVAAMALLLAALTVAAAQLSLFARRDASGVVSAQVVEPLPGTQMGLLRVQGRTVSSHGGPYTVSAPAGALVRPSPPAAVTVIVGRGTDVEGKGSGLQLVGSAIVPLPITGSYRPGAGTTAITLTNQSGHPLEHPWVFLSGRVQSLAAFGESAEIVLDEARWQPFDRLQRTEPNHALLVWAFSRLEGDAILSRTPAWLVGWWRDPALAFAWDGRVDAPLQLVLVPLAASR